MCTAAVASFGPEGLQVMYACSGGMATVGAVAVFALLGPRPIPLQAHLSCWFYHTFCLWSISRKFKEAWGAHLFFAFLFGVVVLGKKTNNQAPKDRSA